MKTADEIIKEASSKEQVIDYNLLEMQLFLVIKQILKMYFNNQISKDEAVRLKLQAVKQYEMNKKEYEFQQNMFQEHIKNIKDTEKLRIKLRKIINDNRPITDEKLSEVINICLEILQITYKENF